MDLVHLWLHESSRVYSDKLMEEKDVELFNKILLDTGKRYFEVRNKECTVISLSLKYLKMYNIRQQMSFFNQHSNPLWEIHECKQHR